MKRRRAIGILLAATAILGGAASGFYTVPTTSVAVTRLFGAVVDAAVPSGVHWWWPPPFGQVDRVEVTRTFTMPIGFLLIDQVRNVQGDQSIGRWLTGDTNIIQLRAKVNYRLADPGKALFASEQPAEILRYVTGSGFTEAASGLPVDEILTSGRLRLIERVRARTQELLDRYGTGLQVLAVTLDSVDPPQSVVAAFQDVQNARADRERAISEAQTYANSVLPVARGEGQRKMNEALSFRDQRVNGAHGDADRFAKLAVEHLRAPELLERRLRLETAERVLPRVKRYVVDPGGDGANPVRIVE